jgi:3D (Asp-Asp-Asp) domain-containing protein
MTNPNATLTQLIRTIAGRTGLPRLHRLCVVGLLAVAGVLASEMVGRAETAVVPVSPIVSASLVYADVSDRQEKQLLETLTIAEEADPQHAVAPTPNTRVLWMEVTAYCPCTKCCGPKARGITASGKRVSYNGGKFVAADTSVLPFGTKLSIPGYHGGVEVKVLDRGGAIKGHKLDVYFPSHRVAKEWGRRFVPVTVVEDNDTAPVTLAAR